MTKGQQLTQKKRSLPASEEECPGRAPAFRLLLFRGYYEKISFAWNVYLGSYLKVFGTFYLLDLYK